jgi:hypothetical protein
VTAAVRGLVDGVTAAVKGLVEGVTAAVKGLVEGVTAVFRGLMDKLVCGEGFPKIADAGLPPNKGLVPAEFPNILQIRVSVTKDLIKSSPTTSFLLEIQLYSRRFELRMRIQDRVNLVVANTRGNTKHVMCIPSTLELFPAEFRTLYNPRKYSMNYC